MRMFLYCMAIAMIAFTVVGCTGQAQQQATTALYQGIGTDRAAVDATTTLVGVGKVSTPDAKTIYTSAVAVEAGLKVWQAAISTNNAAQIQQAQQAVANAVANLLGQLQGLQKAGVHAPGVAMAVRYKAPAPAEKISSSEVISLVEIAVELAPQIEQWVNQLLNAQAVTADQVTQAFADLDASLQSLLAAINHAPPSTQPAGLTFGPKR